jgi:hypothetical protein
MAIFKTLQEKAVEATQQKEGKMEKPVLIAIPLAPGIARYRDIAIISK